MSYFAFLALFLGVPLIALALLSWRDARDGRALPASLRPFSPGWVIAGLVVAAVVYTTPWDNYLVATRVWWYDPALVTGVVLGWVPIEEYTFFVLQTIVTGLWTLFLARRIYPRHAFAPSQTIRWAAGIALAVVWVASVAVLVLSWQPATYLALTLAWALPPILIQVGFGADILRHYGRIVAWSLIPATLYLSLADTIAIGSGTWTIDPLQSTGIFLGSLPLEEFIFFLITNTLVVFGLILVLASESHARVSLTLQRWLGGRGQEDGRGEMGVFKIS